MFRNLENLFQDIKNKLLDSPNIKKLLFYNTSDAISRNEPTYEEVESFIYTKPIIYIYEDSPEKGISSFISIGLAEVVLYPGSMASVVKVSIACDRNIWQLDKNRIRTLFLIDEISKLLDNQKFGPAGKLILSIVKEVYFNNDMVGYVLIFDIREEKGDVVNEF